MTKRKLTLSEIADAIGRAPQTLYNRKEAFIKKGLRLQRDELSGHYFAWEEDVSEFARKISKRITR